MKKTFIYFVLMSLIIAIFSSCAPTTENTVQQSGNGENSQIANVESSQASNSDSDNYKIVVITKNSQTAFWQYSYIGANNYAFENQNVEVVTTGPPSSKDIDKQVTILEDTINSNPDGIVIAPLNGDSLKAGVERAMDQGIKVVLIDSLVNSDKYVTLLATDSRAAGARGAETFVEKLEAKGIPLSGKVGIISPYGGVQYLQDRENGFIDKLKELAPEIEIIGPKFIENDPIKGVSVVEDLLTANNDIIGFYASNNMCGVAISRVVAERNIGSNLVSVTFDSDPEQVSGLRSGSLDALIVQDPYTLGYEGVKTCVESIEGKTFEKYIPTNVVMVTAENVEDTSIQELLDPTLKKLY